MLGYPERLVSRSGRRRAGTSSPRTPRPPWFLPQLSENEKLPHPGNPGYSERICNVEIERKVKSYISTFQYLWNSRPAPSLKNLPLPPLYYLKTNKKFCLTSREFGLIAGLSSGAFFLGPDVKALFLCSPRSSCLSRSLYSQSARRWASSAATPTTERWSWASRESPTKRAWPSLRE